jgi:hypothetical protein
VTSLTISPSMTSNEARDPLILLNKRYLVLINEKKGRSHSIRHAESKVSGFGTFDDLTSSVYILGF